MARSWIIKTALIFRVIGPFVTMILITYRDLCNFCSILNSRIKWFWRENGYSQLNCACCCHCKMGVFRAGLNSIRFVLYDHENWLVYDFRDEKIYFFSFMIIWSSLHRLLLLLYNFYHALVGQFWFRAFEKKIRHFSRL